MLAVTHDRSDTAVTIIFLDWTRRISVVVGSTKLAALPSISYSPTMYSIPARDASTGLTLPIPGWQDYPPSETVRQTYLVHTGEGRRTGWSSKKH